MGYLLTIESEEANALVTELAALTGEAVGPLVVEALRVSLRNERERQKWVSDMLAATDEFAELLDNPPPASDHSWLYDDETGLPA